MKRKDRARSPPDNSEYSGTRNIGQYSVNGIHSVSCLLLKLEVAQQIANHESPRTTKLYDRRQDEISLDEIERITI
jgi:hypothetical protein